MIINLTYNIKKYNYGKPCGDAIYIKTKKLEIVKKNKKELSTGC
jgi:hypothetical protein